MRSYVVVSVWRAGCTLVEGMHIELDSSKVVMGGKAAACDRAQS